MVSKDADKSNSVSALAFIVSIFNDVSLWIFSRAVRWTFKWQDTTFSNTLDMNNRLEIAL